MEDIKEIASRMTRSEFLNKFRKPYYCNDFKQQLEFKCNTDILCKDCWENAVKDIKFKDDLENETFEAECIDPGYNETNMQLTTGKIYLVKQAKYTNFYELENDLGDIDTYRKERFEPLESKTQEPGVNSIRLNNINLAGLTLVDELVKAEEEEKEFKQALLGYLYDKHDISREHLLEELCDTIQVKLSIMKTIDIDIEEIVGYWNTKHLEKIKDRPRVEDKHEEKI